MREIPFSCSIKHVHIIHLLQEELEREGIWDFDRLSLPYIRQEFVQVTDFSVLAIWSTLLMVINSLHLTYDLKTKSDTMSVLIYTSLLFFFPWFQERFGASWTFIVSNFLNGYQKGRYVVNLCFWSIIWGYLLAFWLNLGWSSDEFVTHIEPQIGSWIHVIKEPCHMNWLTCLQFLILIFFHWIASWFFQVVLWSPFC